MTAGMQLPPIEGAMAGAVVLDQSGEDFYQAHQVTRCQRPRGLSWICVEFANATSSEDLHGMGGMDLAGGLVRQQERCQASRHEHDLAGAIDCLRLRYLARLAADTRRLDRRLGISGCPPPAALIMGE